MTLEYVKLTLFLATLFPYIDGKNKFKLAKNKHLKMFILFIKDLKVLITFNAVIPFLVS